MESLAMFDVDSFQGYAVVVVVVVAIVEESDNATCVKTKVGETGGWVGGKVWERVWWRTGGSGKMGGDLLSPTFSHFEPRLSLAAWLVIFFAYLQFWQNIEWERAWTSGLTIANLLG
jgi:hypothetical protein